MAETEDYDKSATPTAHKTSHQDGGTDEISVTGLSGLLGDAQTPLAHKTTHQDAGADEISVEGLAGELTAEQKSAWSKVSGKPTTFTPEAHADHHQDGGADEISVAGLSGTLADDQHIIDGEAVSAMGTKANSNPLNHDRYADSEALAAAVQSGAITDGVTKAPTHDAVYDVKVMTEGHKTRHQDGGSDEISVAGLSGTLADDQHIIDSEAVSAMGTKANSNPLNHDRYADSEALAAAVQSGAITDGVTKAPTHDAVYDVKVMTEDHNARHESGGLDAIKLDDLSAPDDNTDLDASTSKHGLFPKADKVKLDGMASDPTFANSAARAYRSGNQSIPAAEITLVQLNAEDYDVGGNFDASTNYVYTVPAGQAGKYLIDARVNVLAPTASKYYIILIYKNTSILAEVDFIFAGGISASLFTTEVVDLAAGDKVGLRVLFEDAKSVVGGTTYTELTIHRLS